MAESVSALLEVLHDLHDFLEARKGRSERDVRRLQNDVTGRPSPLALAAQVVRDSAATEASQIAQRLCDRLQSSIGGAGHVEVVVRAHGDRYGPIWPPHDFGVLVRSDDPLILGKSEADLRAAKDLLPIVAEMTAVPVIRDLVIAPLAIKVYSGITLPSPESGVDAAASAGLPVLESKSYEAASGVVAALVAMSAVLMLRARERQPTDRGGDLCTRRGQILRRGARHPPGSIDRCRRGTGRGSGGDGANDLGGQSDNTWRSTVTDHAVGRSRRS